MSLIPILFLSTTQQLAPYTETLPKSVVKIEMVAVPGGAITIGDKKVTVKPFWMAKTETTWEAFDDFLASGEPSPPYDQTQFAPDAIARPSKSYILPDLGWGHHGFPAINLTNTTAEMFCRWLSKETKKKYRLPTEAEWELAARSGWKEGMSKADLEKVSWFTANSDGMTHPVAKKEPNPLGLHDMLGNVGEWATDLEGKPILCGPTFEDAEPGPGARRRYSRAWQENDPQIPKSRWWLANGPFVGFRLVCEP